MIIDENPLVQECRVIIHCLVWMKTNLNSDDYVIYKVGDKAIVKARLMGHAYAIGDVITILSINRHSNKEVDYYCKSDYHRGQFILNNKELKPYVNTPF